MDCDKIEEKLIQWTQDNEMKRAAMESYTVATEELNDLLGAATPAAVAATGVRMEESVGAIYGMSGDTNRGTRGW